MRKTKNSNVVEITAGKQNNKLLTPEQRFKSYVAKRDSNGCELWTAGQYSNGYGAFTTGGVTHYAHRWAYEMHNKAAIPPGRVVMHRCDNKLCTAKAHLVLGTTADNNQDKAQKGRSTKGRSITRRAFTPEEIERVVALAASGRSGYAIARATERAEPVISGVLKRNADAIVMKKIRNQFADALQALNDHLAPSIAAIAKITKKAA